MGGLVTPIQFILLGSMMQQLANGEDNYIYVLVQIAFGIFNFMLYSTAY